MGGWVCHQMLCSIGRVGGPPRIVSIVGWVGLKVSCWMGGEPLTSLSCVKRRWIDGIYFWIKLRKVLGYSISILKQSEPTNSKDAYYYNDNSLTFSQRLCLLTIVGLRVRGGSYFGTTNDVSCPGWPPAWHRNDNWPLEKQEERHERKRNNNVCFWS